MDNLRLVGTYIVALDLIHSSSKAAIPATIRRKIMRILDPDWSLATDLAEQWAYGKMAGVQKKHLFIAANVLVLFYPAESIAHKIFLSLVSQMTDEEIDSAKAFAYELVMPRGAKN